MPVSEQEPLRSAPDSSPNPPNPASSPNPTSSPWWRPYTDVALIVLGAAMMAVALNTLLIPNEIVAGGIIGLAVIAEIQLGVPISVALLLMNLPLVYLQWRYLGGLGSVLRTILGVVSLALLTEYSRGIFGPVTHDRLLTVVYGGVLSGVGLAMVFMGRGTTGGSDILCRLVFQFYGWSMGRTMLVVNVLVYGLAAWLFGLEPVMLALLLSYVMSHALDTVMHGITSNRVVWVVTRHPQDVTAGIVQNLGRGVTTLQARGGLSGQDMGFLYMVVPRSGLQRLKRRVLLEDPDAFITVMSPRESVGGFQSMTPPS